MSNKGTAFSTSGDSLLNAPTREDYENLEYTPINEVTKLGYLEDELNPNQKIRNMVNDLYKYALDNGANIKSINFITDGDGLKEIHLHVNTKAGNE